MTTLPPWLTSLHDSSLLHQYRAMHSCAMSTSAKNGPGFNQLHQLRSSICRYGWTAVTWNGYRHRACSKSLLHHRRSSDIKFYVDAAAELDTRLIDNARRSVNTAFTQPALPTPGIPVALLIPSVTISRMDIMQRNVRRRPHCRP